MTSLPARPNTALVVVDRARAEHVAVIWVRHSDADLVADTDGWRIVPELQPAHSLRPIVRTNMSWSWQDAPDRVAAVVDAADVDFADLSDRS